MLKNSNSATVLETGFLEQHIDERLAELQGLRQRLAVLLCCGLGLLGSLLSQTRGGWLALALCLLVFLQSNVLAWMLPVQ